MEMFKKLVKGFVLSMLLYIVMTGILAGILYFTEFKETWSQIGLIVVLGSVSMFFGYVESNIVGKKRIVVWIVSAIFFIAINLLAISLIF